MKTMTHVLKALSLGLLIPATSFATIYNGNVTYFADSMPSASQVPVYNGNQLRTETTPVLINPTSGAMSGQISATTTITASTYTLGAQDLGKQLYFNKAGAVTLTVPASTSLSVGSFWQIAAASGTTITISLASGGDSLLGQTSLAATESSTLMLRAPLIYENDPRFQTAGPGAGTVTNVSSANADIAVATGTTTPVLTLNSATADTVSTIVKRDGSGNFAAGTITAGGLAVTGTATINNSGAGVTTIGTGGTGAVNIGNATGNTAVTGSLTASNGLFASAGGAGITGTTNINASAAGVTTIGTGGTGAVNIGNATGNTAVTGSLTASTTLTSTLGNITASNGSLGLPTAGTGLILNPVTGTAAAGSTATCNGRLCIVTFTTVSIASGATQVLTVADSAITGSGTAVMYSMSGATAGSALTAASAVPSAGQWVLTLTNATGAGIVTSTANIVLVIFVLS